MSDTQRNWLNMPSHPTDAWAYWRVRKLELLFVRDTYDDIIECMTGNASMSERKAHEIMAKFVSWVRENATSDALYNDRSEA